MALRDRSDASLSSLREPKIAPRMTTRIGSRRTISAGRTISEEQCTEHADKSDHSTNQEIAIRAQQRARRDCDKTNEESRLVLVRHSGAPRPVVCDVPPPRVAVRRRTVQIAG